VTGGGSGNNGYVQLRRGIQDHCREGKLPPMAFGVYVHLLLEADKSSGIAWSSAKAMALNYGYQERTARSAMETLEKGGYIKRFTTPGRHSNYPVAVNKYFVTDGARSGMLLNAIETDDWKCPIYEDLQPFVRLFRFGIFPLQRLCAFSSHFSNLSLLENKLSSQLSYRLLRSLAPTCHSEAARASTASTRSFSAFLKSRPVLPSDSSNRAVPFLWRRGVKVRIFGFLPSFSM